MKSQAFFLKSKSTLNTFRNRIRSPKCRFWLDHAHLRQELQKSDGVAAVVGWGSPVFVCFLRCAHREGGLQKYILLCQTTSSCIEHFSMHYNAQGIKFASGGISLLIVEAQIVLFPQLKKTLTDTENIVRAAFLHHILKLQ